MSKLPRSKLTEGSVESASVGVSSKIGWQQFWHTFWVQDVLFAFSRWSAPFALADHRLPAAIPAGLVSESEIGTHPCRMDLKSLIDDLVEVLLGQRSENDGQAPYRRWRRRRRFVAGIRGR